MRRAVHESLTAMTRQRSRVRRATREIRSSPRELLALALFAVAPLLIMPGALDRFVFVKAAAAAAGVAVALTAPRRGRLAIPVMAVLAAGGLLLLAAAVSGAAPVAQLVGRGPRYEGLPMLALYAAAGGAGARLLGPARPGGSIRWFGRWLAVAAILVGALAVLEAFGLRPLETNVSRPGSLLGNASDEGALAVLMAAPLTALALSFRDRVMSAGAGFAGLTVVLSASRGALLGLVVVAVVIAAAAASRGAVLAVGTALAAAVLLVVALPQVRHRAFGESSFAGHTTHGRVLLWGEAVATLASTPLLGVGPSGFEDAVVAHHTLTWQKTVGPANPPDSPHNWVLQAATAGGWTLALLALVAAGYATRAAVRRIRDERSARAPPLAAGLAAGLAGYGVALLFHMTSPGTTPLAAVFAGALLATEATAGRRRALDTVGTAAAGLLAGVFLLGAIAEIPLKAAVVAVTHSRLVAADHDFRLARDLRPWDVEMPLAAGHAFAAVALSGDSAAGAYGLPWLRDALRRLPTSEQAREDLAAVDAAGGDLVGARRLLGAALRRDRFNPELLLRRGVTEAEAKDYRDAERDFLAASRIAVRSPQPWQDLATLYRLENRLADATTALSRADEIRPG